MIRIILSLCCLLTGPAFAQQINVRSGAHSGFARLVVDAPAGANWTIQQNATGAELTLSEHTGGFDTSTVFDRIDQSFIASVSAESSILRIEFACKCRVEVFNQGAEMIVLDVLEGEPDNSDDADLNLGLGFVGNQTLRFQQKLQPAPLRPSPADETSPVEKSVARLSQQTDLLPQVLSAQTENPSQDIVRLSEAREQIVRHVGTAATRGVLNTINGLNIPENSVPRPQIDTRAFVPPSEFAPEASYVGDPTGNIRITDSSHPPIGIQDQHIASNSDGISCLDPQRFHVNTWGAENTLSQKTSQLRSQLYGEFDQLQKETALQLTRAYLYFGFGAEARQTLTLDRDLISGYPELIAISDILEFGHSRESKYLSRFLECDSDAALWAVLSVQSIDPTTSINVDAALRGASALPMHLRIVLAPELSSRLLAYGDSNSASAALRSVERAPQTLSQKANLAKADLELEQKTVSKAQYRLAEIVNSNSEQSAKALIKFVDSHLAEDSEIDENVATLVEAYAQEMRGDPLELELRRTHILALGKSNQFSAAFDALHRIRLRKTDMESDPLRSSVLDLLTRHADDVAFLEHAFSQIQIAPEALTPKSRLQLAQRLVKLGFAQQAQIVLESDAGYSEQEQVALLRAEISLDLERPHEALAHLFGLASSSASLLRAEAEARVGDFSSAHQIYTELGNTPETEDVAWLAQDWSVRVEQTTPVFGPMVSIAQTTLEDQVEREGILERTEAAISESQNARAVIETLLNESKQTTLESE